MFWKNVNRRRKPQEKLEVFVVVASQCGCMYALFLEVHPSLLLVLLSGSSMLLLALGRHWSSAIMYLPDYCGYRNPPSRTIVEGAPNLQGRDIFFDHVRESW
jgi:hypothetical protein